MRLNPFLRGAVWWARIPRLEQPSVQRSLDVRGKENRDVALEVVAFLRWLWGRRESFLLDQLASGKCRVGPAYQAYIDGRLDTFTRELRDGVEDVDLEPFVARWQRELERRKKPNAETRAKYLRQVRTLLPAGQPFRRSQFTKQLVRAWLNDLSVGQPNRYRAALSSFAEFLVFEDAIVTNPVRQVKMAAEAEPRTKHLTQKDARKLLDALEDQPEMQTFHALMLATGMEFGAARRLDASTVTSDSVYAEGSKNAHRKRIATVYDRWRWAWVAVCEWIDAHPDSRHPFRHIQPWDAYRALKGALAVAKLDREYTTHDHRHTWAVQAIRDGLAPHVIAYQLGHRDATMLTKVYGRFRPQSSDYRSAASAKEETPV
ncbi:MAG TPA: tyrosine-type recombinase/integrase [Gemmatimonadaceae bacterium]|nr:tyrosine-type recombinase/integrase [Gemmatimonadaceae bacterium]